MALSLWACNEAEHHSREYVGYKLVTPQNPGSKENEKENKTLYWGMPPTKHHFLSGPPPPDGNSSRIKASRCEPLEDLKVQL